MALTRLKEILDDALAKIKESKTSEHIAAIRNTFLSKKSELMSMFSLLGKLDPEERKEAGKQINDTKVAITEALEAKEKEISEKELKEKLMSEEIDISLPGRNYFIGGKNPFHIIKDEMIDIFLGMGFEVKD